MRRYSKHPIPVFISCTAILLQIFETASATTSAEMDWRKTNEATQCKGHYEETKIDTTKKVNASAKSAVHIEGNSTTLKGDVVLTHKNQQLKADLLIIEAKTEVYTAEGRTQLRQPGLLLKGDRIKGSLVDNTAVIENSHFLLHGNRIRGSAKKISKSQNDELTIEKGKFTTCEPNNNLWQVTGESIVLKRAKGYGIAEDVTLKIKNAPIAYFPWFRFPIDDGRQSGFLSPSVGHDSDGGTDLALPFYFNIKPNIDATYTIRNMHRRGLMHEGELRYLNKRSENLMALAYLPSDNTFDGREIIVPSVEFSGQKRWLAHFTHRGNFGNWSSRVNYTSVSDIDYFQDLGSFTNTESRLDRAVGQNDRPAILRSGHLSYKSKNWGGAIELRSFQELNQLQTKQPSILPRLSLYGQHRISNLKFSGLAQLTEFDKSDNSPKGNRVVFDAQIELPFRRPWGFIKPSVRTIHRDYRLENTGAIARETASLTTTLSSVDLGLTFVRETDLRGKRFRQTLEPRLYFLNVQEKFQDDLPSFDSTPITPSYSSLFSNLRYTGYDRIGDSNQMAIGLNTSYYSISGAPIFSASVGQVLHFEDRKVNFGITEGTDPTANSSPLFVTLKTEYRNFNISAKYEYDEKTTRSNRGYVSVRYANTVGAILNFTYALTDSSIQRDRFLRPEEESDITFVWPFGNKVNFIGRWNYAWDSRQTIESLLGVEYNACCWKARVVFRRNLKEPRRIGITMPNDEIGYYTDRRADSGIYFELQLLGLASLGGRLDSLIRDSIPGFTRSQ